MKTESANNDISGSEFSWNLARLTVTITHSRIRYVSPNAADRSHVRTVDDLSCCMQYSRLPNNRLFPAYN